MNSNTTIPLPAESEFAPAILAFCIIVFAIAFIFVLVRFLLKYHK